MTCTLHSRIEEVDEEIGETRLKLRVLRQHKTDLERMLAMMEYPAERVLDFFADNPVGPPQLDTDVLGGRFSKMGRYVEVARGMALHGDGRVKVVEVAREVKNLNLSEAKHSSLCATIHKALAKVETFEQTGPGEFEYVK